MVYKIYGVYTVITILYYLYYRFIFLPSHTWRVISNWLNGKIFKEAIALAIMIVIDVIYTAGILIFLIVTWNL